MILRERDSAPSGDTLSLKEIRDWCAFDMGITEDDPILTQLVTEAISFLEGDKYTQGEFNGRKLLEQTWFVSLDAEDLTNPINIPLKPVSEIVEVTTYNSAGEKAVMDSSYYRLRTGEYPRMVFNSAYTWPNTRTYDAAKIEVTVGYGTAADLPADLKLLIKGLVQHLYASKGTGLREMANGSLMSIPYFLKKLITKYRVKSWK